MRILMVYPNRNRMLCPAPIGALLVSERLKRDGHEVRLLSLMHVKDAAATLTAAIRDHRPELLCFSIRNVDNQMMRTLDHPLDDLAELAALARRQIGAPLLIGGTAVTTFPSQIRAKLGADYAFGGDDVDLAARFVASLAAGQPDLATPGLAYARDGAEQCNPPVLCGYRAARFTGFDQLELKANLRRGYYDCGLPTHTGCPNGCSFCDAHRTFGPEYVLRDIPTVVDELTELRRKHGARSIWLINSGINRPLAYGKELCARIAEARLGLALAFLIEPGEFDAELARLMKKAGSSGAMLFGTSLDDGVLERNQPFYRRADVVKAAELMRDVRVDYYLGQMYGAPGETLDTVTASLELAYRLKPAMIITGYGFRVQPDTPLREVAVRAGVLSADDDCFAPRFYLSPDTPADALGKRIRRFHFTHPWQVARFIGFVGRSMIGSVFQRGEA